MAYPSCERLPSFLGQSAPLARLFLYCFQPPFDRDGKPLLQVGHTRSSPLFFAPHPHLPTPPVLQNPKQHPLSQALLVYQARER